MQRSVTRPTRSARKHLATQPLILSTRSCVVEVQPLVSKFAFASGPLVSKFAFAGGSLVSKFSFAGASQLAHLRHGRLIRYPHRRRRRHSDREHGLLLVWQVLLLQLQEGEGSSRDDGADAGAAGADGSFGRHLRPTLAPAASVQLPRLPQLPWLPAGEEHATRCRARVTRRSRDDDNDDDRCGRFGVRQICGQKKFFFPSSFALSSTLGALFPLTF